MSNTTDYILKLFNQKKNIFTDCNFSLFDNIEQEITSILSNINLQSLIKGLSLLSHNSKVRSNCLFSYLRYYLSKEQAAIVIIYLSLFFFSIKDSSTEEEKEKYERSFKIYKDFSLKVLVLNQFHLFNISNIKNISDNILLNERLKLNQVFDFYYICVFFLLYSNDKQKAHIFFNLTKEDNILTASKNYLYQFIKKIILLSLLGSDYMILYELKAQSFINTFTQSCFENELSQYKFNYYKHYLVNKPVILISSSNDDYRSKYKIETSIQSKNSLFTLKSTSDIFHKMSNDMDFYIIYKHLIVYLLSSPLKLKEFIYNLLQNTLFINHQSKQRLNKEQYISAMEKTNYGLFNPNFIRDLLIKFVLGQPYIDLYLTEFRKLIIFNERKINSQMKDYDPIINQYSYLSSNNHNQNNFSNIFHDTKEFKSLKSILSRPELYEFLKKINDYNLGLMLSEIETFSHIRKKKTFKKKHYNRDNYKKQEIISTSNIPKPTSLDLPTLNDSFEERKNLMNLLLKHKKEITTLDDFNKKLVKLLSPKRKTHKAPVDNTALKAANELNKLLIENTNQNKGLIIEDMPHNIELDNEIDALLMRKINLKESKKLTDRKKIDSDSDTTDNYEKPKSRESAKNRIVKFQKLFNFNTPMSKIVSNKTRSTSQLHKLTTINFNQRKESSNDNDEHMIEDKKNKSLDLSVISKRKEDFSIYKADSNVNIFLLQSTSERLPIQNKKHVVAYDDIDFFYCVFYRDIDYIELQKADETRLIELQFNKYIPMILQEYYVSNDDTVVIKKRRKSFFINDPIIDKAFLNILSSLKLEEIETLYLEKTLTFNTAKLCYNIFSNIAKILSKSEKHKKITFLPYNFYESVILLNNTSANLQKELNSSILDKLNPHTHKNVENEAIDESKYFIELLPVNEFVVLPIFPEGNFSFILFDILNKKMKLVTSKLFDFTIYSKKTLSYISKLYNSDLIEISLIKWTVEYIPIDLDDAKDFSMKIFYIIDNLLMRNSDIEITAKENTNLIDYSEKLYLYLLEVLQNFIDSRVNKNYYEENPRI